MVQNAWRRHLCDMHIDDWNDELLSQLSPEDYVNNLKTAKIQNAMLYFQSHVGLCYYPTASGKMHNSFVGKEDTMRRIADLCHEAGISVTGYYSLIYNNWAHDNYPSWRMIDLDGKSLLDGKKGVHSEFANNNIFRYGLCCPNNMEYRAFVAEQIKEMADYFDFEGMFFDMLFWPHMCYCDSCKKRWEEEVGSSLPEKEDWNDERWLLHNREMKRICEGGSLGKIVYAEGEYNHAGNGDPNVTRYLIDSLKHWRNYLPRTYYITHSLGPLMYVTGAEPVRVTAMPIFDPPPADSKRASRSGDRAAIITCLNDDKSVFKVVASSNFGASSDSYRFCGQRGMVENIRGTGGSEAAGTEGKIMLRYNAWQIPEGMEEVNFYQPELNDKDAELIKKSAHGGGDFIVMRTFLDCVRNNKKPDFDVYFATKMASTAILAHRSVLAGGMPFDVPDFRKEEDRIKYENDTDSPFWYSDGTAPTVRSSSDPNYEPTRQQIENLDRVLRGED